MQGGHEGEMPMVERGSTRPAMIALSIPRGPVRERYAGWSKLVR